MGEIAEKRGQMSCYLTAQVQSGRLARKRRHAEQNHTNFRDDSEGSKVRLFAKYQHRLLLGFF